MGRITIFTQPNCKYCDKVKSVFNSIIERMRDELAAVKPAYGIEVRVSLRPSLHALEPAHRPLMCTDRDS